MRAMVLNALGRLADNPTRCNWTSLPDPVPADGELLIKVQTCGVCHTELDEIEGRMPPPRLPIILGHQVVGRVAALGARTSAFQVGDRVGVAWIYSACGMCGFCRRGEENLCDQFRATGRDANGGYAELMTVPEAFAHRIPDVFTDAEAAPLLCAGAIGYRSLRLTGLKDGQNLGSDRLRRFGAPRPQDGPKAISPLPRCSSSPGRGGTCVRPGARCDLGRRHPRAISREAASHHRYHPRLVSDRRGAREPRTGGATGHQCDPERG